MRAPCKDCPFLSTPSARRATHSVDGAGRHRDISIHALREEGDLNGGKHFAFAIISIHALREEGDDRAVVRDHECRGFLSTPSARRATSTLVFSL